MKAILSVTDSILQAKYMIVRMSQSQLPTAECRVMGQQHATWLSSNALIKSSYITNPCSLPAPTPTTNVCISVIVGDPGRIAFARQGGAGCIPRRVMPSQQNGDCKIRRDNTADVGPWLNSATGAVVISDVTTRQVPCESPGRFMYISCIGVWRLCSRSA